MSRRIRQRVIELDEYRTARTLMTYVSGDAEVDSHDLMHKAWGDAKQVVVPCCMEDNLELYCLRSMKELVPRTIGILEPREEILSDIQRKVEASQVDLFVVPGLAFDPAGGRVGHGKGYFDRLLARAGPRTARIAVAFQCQVFPEVPMAPYDVRMDKVVTEERVYISP